jgi:hypothetical protein
MEGNMPTNDNKESIQKLCQIDILKNTLAKSFKGQSFTYGEKNDAVKIIIDVFGKGWANPSNELDEDTREFIKKTVRSVIPSDYPNPSVIFPRLCKAALQDDSTP